MFIYVFIYLTVAALGTENKVRECMEVLCYLVDFRFWTSDKRQLLRFCWYMNDVQFRISEFWIYSQILEAAIPRYPCERIHELGLSQKMNTFLLLHVPLIWICKLHVYRWFGYNLCCLITFSFGVLLQFS